jgi:hypothetical protein
MFCQFLSKKKKKKNPVDVNCFMPRRFEMNQGIPSATRAQINKNWLTWPIPIYILMGTRFSPEVHGPS